METWDETFQRWGTELLDSYVEIQRIKLGATAPDGSKYLEGERGGTAPATVSDPGSPGSNSGVVVLVGIAIVILLLTKAAS